MKNLSKAFVLVLDEALLVIVALFVLSKLGVSLSAMVVIAVIVLLAIWLLILYRIILSLGKRKKLTGKEGMIGLRGVVVEPLSPEGVIRIHGELWEALSTEGNIDVDKEVVVKDMEALKLFVARKDKTGKSG